MEYKKYSIGEVKKLTGMSIRMIRYLSDNNYIDPPMRVTCGSMHYRYYSMSDINLIRNIIIFQNQGYSLKDASILARKNN